MDLKGILIIFLLVFFVSCGGSTKRPIQDDDTNDIDGTGEDNDTEESDDDEAVIPDTCGNKKIDEGEICDGNLVDCVDINDRLYSGGKAWCRDDCLGYDTVTCEEVFHECGNGEVEGPEECDGGIIDCVNIDPYKYSGGKAACEDDCSGWDTITCDEREPLCGDGIVELGEVCDSETVRCAEVDSKYYLGMADCNDDCSGWILDNCIEGVAECGNNIVEGLEVCDGSIDECVDIDPSKYSGGKAYCLKNCSGWDTVTCTEKSGIIDWSGGASFLAAFDPRASHCSAYFNGKFWVIAGSGAPGGVDTTFSDVWSSNDGITWTKEVESAPFGSLQRHKCPVYDGKLWVIGGRDGSGTHNSKVWYSSNGTSWIEDTVGLDDFLPGANFEALVKGSNLYVFSVSTNILTPSKGIWERNMHGWNRKSETVPYGTDSSFAGGVIGGTFFLSGGIDASFQTTRSTIWYSNNGTEWESAQGDFFPRAFHSKILINGAFYMIGGNTLVTRTNDVLRSSEGLKWGVVSNNAGFEGRSSHTVAASLSKLCVIGGTFAGGTYTNDVWCVNI